MQKHKWVYELKLRAFYFMHLFILFYPIPYIVMTVYKHRSLSLSLWMFYHDHCVFGLLFSMLPAISFVWYAGQH